MKFCPDSNLRIRIIAKPVVKDGDGTVTMYAHVHRDGRVGSRGQCPHPECVIKDVIDS